MSVRIKKVKPKGVDKSQKQKLEEVINMLFADSTKHMPLHDLISKYVTYKNYFKSMLKLFLSFSNISHLYEPKIKDLVREYMKCYRQYFTIDHNAVSDEALEAFYKNYDEFKKSEFLQWITRIAFIIKKSDMLTKTFREFCIACQNSSISLTIFTNVLESVPISYDYVKLFHEGSSVSKDDKIQAWQNLKSIYTFGKKIYKLTIQPDLPLDYIFNELITGLGKYRAKIRNADKLFDLLQRKSELFKNNFSKYYKEMVQFNSPMNLLTSFLSDVKDDKDIQDPTLLLQCKTLIKELQKSFATMPGIKQDKDMGKVNSLIDFINNYIDTYQELGTKPPPEDIDKLNKQYEEQFLASRQ